MPRHVNWEVRHRFYGNRRDLGEPIHATPLTPDEVLVKRLELAEEMFALILRDGAPLAPRVRRTIRQLSQRVITVRQECCASPGKA
jgi:hypothetical protein